MGTIALRLPERFSKNHDEYPKNILLNIYCATLIIKKLPDLTILFYNVQLKNSRYKIVQLKLNFWAIFLNSFFIDELLVNCAFRYSKDYNSWYPYGNSLPTTLRTRPCASFKSGYLDHMTSQSNHLLDSSPFDAKRAIIIRVQLLKTYD